MENLLPQVTVIRTMGSIAGPVRPDLKLPMIATRDIGEVAAAALLGKAFRGKQTQELQGQRDLDYVEATNIIGRNIGKPGLGYIQAPNNQLKAALAQMGMNEAFVELILEMAGALNSGYIGPLEPRNNSTTTPTTFEDFVKNAFVPAYQQQAAA